MNIFQTILELQNIRSQNIWQKITIVREIQPISLIYNTLISGGKVIDKKIGNSFHKLYINNEDEFNIISRLLSEIDNLIQAMDEPTHKYYFKIAHATAAELSYLQPVKDYLFGYQGQVDRILKVLLLRISELSLPEKESQGILRKTRKTIDKSVTPIQVS